MTGSKMRDEANQAIRKVCVIGAGTMGAGIAAQVANCGCEVLLLDIASTGKNRNEIVDQSITRIAKSDPPLLMEQEHINRIAIGNIDDDLAAAKDCDWIVEAIVERLDIKRELFHKLLPYLKPDVMVSSNTSTIPISLLMEGMPEKLSRRFCITHFFNPVRYMRLLELVRGENTDDEVIEILADFSDRQLGKGVVKCADTPGFLGNRVGVFAMQAAIYEAMEMGIKIEDADALFGRPMGIPKTGVFGLYDLIGLDLMADVVRSLRGILPPDDPFHEVGGENALINSQVEKGFLGNKSGGGFYREQNGQQFALDLATCEWRNREQKLPTLALDLKEGSLSGLVQGEDLLSRYCWRILARILTYSASLLPEVTHSPQDIDDAMKLGYNWTAGPFEMIDALGVDWFCDRLQKEGFIIPPFLVQCAGSSIYYVDGSTLKVRNWQGKYENIILPENVHRFHLMRRTLSTVFANDSASLFHLNDGIRLVEFHTKANALDEHAMAVVAHAAQDPGPGILIHNDAQHFSAGVNLERFLAMMQIQDWQAIDSFLSGFQSAVTDLKYCPAPVVGAPSGLAIGGGYEVLAHCDVVVAHANCILGLVEASVGLVPGGGGVKETYWRWYQKTSDWEKAAWHTFNQIGYGQIASSPMLAAKLCYFDPERDIEIMNRDRLIATGRRTIKKLHSDYQSPTKPVFKLAGEKIYGQMVEFLDNGYEKGQFFAHEVVVARAIATIVTGGKDADQIEISESDLFERERREFISLAKSAATLERVKSMLLGKGTIRN